jgi:hypothetical protein
MGKFFGFSGPHGGGGHHGGHHGGHGGGGFVGPTYGYDYGWPYWYPNVVETEYPQQNSTQTSALSYIVAAISKDTTLSTADKAKILAEIAKVTHVKK